MTSLCVFLRIFSIIIHPLAPGNEIKLIIVAFVKTKTNEITTVCLAFIHFEINTISDDRDGNITVTRQKCIKL